MDPGWFNRGNGGHFEQRLNERLMPDFIDNRYGDSWYYDYNQAGRITSINAISDNAYDRSFSYDDAGRLTAASGPWGSGSYQYDRLGNLKQKRLGSRTVDIQYNSKNRVASVRDTAVSSSWRAYSYDARGNVTHSGIHTFSYDFANQPVSVNGPGGGTYTYDGNLKRVKQVVGGDTIYSIYDSAGTLLTQQNITQNQTTDYLSVGGQTLVRVKNGVESYPINDHLGSAYRVADRNGSVAASQRFNYTPFGETLGAGPGANTEQGFTGHVEDRTGLVYMQARFYDPAIGRFLQTDPIGYEDQVNLYAYVHNNPVSLYDPFGLRSNCRPMADTVGTSCSYIDQASTETSEQVDNESAQKETAAQRRELLAKYGIKGKNILDAELYLNDLVFDSSSVKENMALINELIPQTMGKSAIEIQLMVATQRDSLISFMAVDTANLNLKDAAIYSVKQFRAIYGAPNALRMAAGTAGAMKELPLDPTSLDMNVSIVNFYVERWDAWRGK